MTNFSLVEVEGGSAIPTGSLVSFPPTYPSAFTLEGITYATDGVPGRVIPDFDTKVDASVKGPVLDYSFAVLNVADTGSDGICAAGVSSDGTLVRCAYVVGSNYVAIDVKYPTDSVYKPVYQSSTQWPTHISAQSFVVTNNSGTWVAVCGTLLLVSKDNGVSWSENVLANISSEYASDLKCGSNGTFMLVARSNSSSSQRRLFRSTDGINWAGVSVGANIGNVAHVTGSTWAAVVPAILTTYSSTDDGLTWATGPTLGVTPSSNSHANQLECSNGRFYLLDRDNNTLYSGTSLGSMALVTSGAGKGIGVDNAGNVCIISTTGQWRYSVAGGAANIPSANTRTVNINSPSRFSVKWSNGVWVDSNGSFITDADWRTNNKSVTSQTFCIPSGFGAVIGDYGSGVGILALNCQSYLRTTDNWKTYSILPFSTAVASLPTLAYVAGCATDGFGNWTVVFTGAAVVYYSTDNGLTWTTKTPAVGAVVRSVVGGGASGTFMTVSSTGAAVFTQNGWTSTSNKTPTKTSLTGANIVKDGKYFKWFTNDGTSIDLCFVDMLTGALTQHILAAAPAVGSYISTGVISSGSSVFLDTYAYFGGGVTPPTEKLLGTAVYNTYLGKLNGLVISSVASASFYPIGPGMMFPHNPIRSISYVTKGIKDMGLPSTSYIKVS